MFDLLFSVEYFFSRNSFDSYYMPLIGIILIYYYNKLFFDQPVKNKQEAYEKKQETMTMQQETY